MALLGSKKTFLTGLTDVNSSDKEGVGALRWEGNKCYKYVVVKHVGATVAGALGDAVVYNAVTGGMLSAVVIDDTDADPIPHGAGILQGTVAGVDGTEYFCWIQIKGPSVVLQTIAGSSPADGQSLQASGADKSVALHVDVDAGGDAITAIGSIIGVDEKTIFCDFPF